MGYKKNILSESINLGVGQFYEEEGSGFFLCIQVAMR